MAVGGQADSGGEASENQTIQRGPREPHLAEENTEENHDSELRLLKKVDGGKARRGSPMYCSLEQN